MKSFSLYPLAGIDQISNDEALQGRGKAPYLYVRDAVNVNITPTGQAAIRNGARLATAQPYASLWQSPLHGDTFARLGDKWVKVNTADWSHEVLAVVGDGPLSHLVLNGKVLVAAPGGLFEFDGRAANRLVLDVPPGPMLAVSAGALVGGQYGLAVAWLRGKTEGPLSPMVTITVPQDGQIDAILPMAFDPTVTGVRLYSTRPDGGELLRLGDYPGTSTVVSLPTLPTLGAPAPFPNMEAMPTGRYLGQWRGRLVVAIGSVLRFSQAMAYHVHDVRHDFVQMPQRITFVAPVDGGLWVGQVDHVAFLRGSAPDELVLERKTGRAPVPGSLVELHSDDAGEAAGGGRAAVAWLSSVGFVLGTPDGGIIEPQSKRLRGISAASGSTVVQHGRLTAALR